MSATYGYDLKDGDKLLEAPVQASGILNKLLLPGGALVNDIPICVAFYFILAMLVVSQVFSVRYIPSWVPYFSYKPVARRLRKLSERMRNEPIDFVKNALVCVPCSNHAPRLREFMLNDTACHSIMAPRCIHWRASTCRSWTAWKVRNVKSRRRPLRNRWVQYIGVKQ